MKRIFTFVCVILFVLAFSSCSIIRNRIVGAFKSAAAGFTLSPAETVEAYETAVSAQAADETSVSDDTSAPDNSTSVEETAMPMDTVTPEDEQSPPPNNELSLDTILAEIPDNIPIFKAGTVDDNFTIRNESGDSIIYNIKFDNVKKEDVKAFGPVIKKAGFTVYTSESNSTYSVTGTKMKGNDMQATISLSFDSSSGSCNFTLMLNSTKK